MTALTPVTEKEFTMEQVLSVVSGIFCCEKIEELYDILSFLTSERLYTHQLPRASRWARPLLISQHPRLKYFARENKIMVSENYKNCILLAKNDEKHGMGETLTIKKPKESFGNDNPITELVEMMQQ